MSRIAVPILLSFLLFFLAMLSASATTITIGDIFSETEATTSIMINDAIDVATVRVAVTYDPSVIVVTAADVEAGDFEVFYDPEIDNERGWTLVGALQMTTEEGLSGTRKLAELTIAPVGSYGKISNLNLKVVELSDSEYGLLDKDIDVDGFFYIGVNGDVYADRVINSDDSLYIAKGIAGIEELKVGASEVSGDGIVDAYDCVYLARHAAGISGYEELH